MTVERTARMGPMDAARELWEYRPLVLNLANRQLKSQYKQSLLGNLWSLLNPALTLGVYSLVFGVMLDFGRNVPIGGNGELKSFPMFLFCALILWSLFNRAAIGAMGQFSSTGSLLRKVYFPPAAPIVAHGLAQIRQTAASRGLVAMFVFALLEQRVLALRAVAAVDHPHAHVRHGGGVRSSAWPTPTTRTPVVHHVRSSSQLLFYCTPIIYSTARLGDSELLRRTGSPPWHQPTTRCRSS